MDTERLRTVAVPPGLDCGGRRAQLRLGECSWGAYYADEERGDSGLRRPARIGLDLIWRSRVQVVATSTMRMHIEQPRDDEHACRIDDVAGAARPTCKRADARAVNGDVALGQIRNGIDQVGPV